MAANQEIISPEQLAKNVMLMPEAQRAQILSGVIGSVSQCFVPSPGPQTRAYYSPADVLLYGGQAGGGKSALLLGLALTAHRRSLIMRRQYTDLTAIIDEGLKFYGSRDGFNGSSPPSLKTKDGRFIQWGACANPGDEHSWQGQAHGLKGFDEVTQFQEAQVRYICGWTRSTDPLETRCRVVFASNPPTDTSGDWIIGMFRPWLDMTDPNPAEDGELRWVVTDKNGKDVWVADNTPIQDGFTIEGKPNIYTPKSRTFIKSTLSDNPYLVNTDYKSTLDAMPEPYRSAMRDGNFMMARKDDDNQAIPTAWVQASQARWTERAPEGVPMCAIGVDPAAGGTDETILAPRYDGYYPKMIVTPGIETPFPQDVAAKVLRYRKGDATPVVDCGGGYGGGIVRHLQDNGIECKAHKGSEKSTKRSADRLYAFANKRAEVYWKFREALDPSQDGGSPIILPPDAKLLSDLCSVRFTITSRGIQLESKDDMKKRLGRSPDRGDAVVLAWSHGEYAANQKGGVWGESKKKSFPKSIMGHMNQRRTR
jgi:hypothetical protein